MEYTVELQQQFCSETDEKRFCSFNYGIIEEKRRPVLHQTSRFLFFNKGKGKIKINEIEYDITEDTVVGILPWDCTEITEVKETFQFYVVIYNHILINDVIKSLFNVANEEVPTVTKIKDTPVIHCNETYHKLLKESFRKIRDEVGVECTMEFPEPKLFQNIYVVNLLTELIVRFCRASEECGQAKKEEVVEKNNCSRIFKYIYAHLSEKITLSKLSKLFYMSESSISRYIMDTTGLTFNNLLNEIRVSRTLNYLMYTEYTLEELATILGYVDAAHISKVFESRMENKITDYRKTYQTVLQICNIKERKLGYRVVSYIVDNHKEEITVQSVATEFDITVVELNRILLLQTEKNFFEFLNFMRVNSACQLLVTTDLAMTDIAIEVGYNTVKTFTRNFVYFKNITPSSYRKKVRLDSKDNLSL